MMLNIFSYVSWPSVCLLWRQVYLDLVHLMTGLIFFFFFFDDVKHNEPFINFGD